MDSGKLLPPEAAKVIKTLQQREVAAAQRLANTQTAITHKAYLKTRKRGIDLIVGQVDPDLDRASGKAHAHHRNTWERGTLLKVVKHWGIYTTLFTLAFSLVAFPILHSLAVAVFIGAIATLVTY